MPEIKDGAYVINLHHYELIGTHWIALYVNVNNVAYFDSFGFEHIPKEIKKLIGNKTIANILQNTIIQFDNVQMFFYWIY